MVDNIMALGFLKTCHSDTDLRHPIAHAGGLATVPPKQGRETTSRGSGGQIGEDE
jgi:hypothetical protein